MREDVLELVLMKGAHELLEIICTNLHTGRNKCTFFLGKSKSIAFIKKLLLKNQRLLRKRLGIAPWGTATLRGREREKRLRSSQRSRIKTGQCGLLQEGYTMIVRAEVS